jgi:hypothetical protein
MKDVKSIVKEYLNKNGYDGLCYDDCGCKNDDLFPCGNGPRECKPGHLNVFDDGEWEIVERKGE